MIPHFQNFWQTADNYEIAYEKIRVNLIFPVPPSTYFQFLSDLIFAIEDSDAKPSRKFIGDWNLRIRPVNVSDSKVKDLQRWKICHQV